MIIKVQGYQEDGSLGTYDQAIKAHHNSCETKEETCSNWLFISIIIAIICILSYICLQGGLARHGETVQIQGLQGDRGPVGERGLKGRDTFYDPNLIQGLITKEAVLERKKRYDQAVKLQKKLEREKAKREAKIEADIASGRRHKSGVLIT
mmetsp:Transcript_4385/g.6913  ORF Transcript_4385/g.6913 Transcript_4385/m.6913 type:complete len:151 (+) Transcript_4385:77-529(+)